MHYLLLFLFSLPLATCSLHLKFPTLNPSPTISNIIGPSHCPDPAVVFHNGYYYATRSRIENSTDNRDPEGWNCWSAAQDQVIITRARHLQDVYTNPDAVAVIINRASPFGGTVGGISVGAFGISYKQGDGCPSAGFWAPSLKRIDGHWFLFVTGHRPDIAGEMNFLIESDNEDPLIADSWQYRGMLGHQLPGLDGEPIVLPTNDPLAMPVVLQENGKLIAGQLYYVYSHNNKERSGTQQLHLVRLVQDTSEFVEYDADRGMNITFNTKFTAAGEGMIGFPYYDWENKKCSGCEFSVNEGPTALYGPDKTFILYSASFCATKYYAIGMLEFVGEGSTGFPFLWAKHPLPVFSGDVFQTSPKEKSDLTEEGGSDKVTGVRDHAFGIGHNSVTASPDLSEYWIVYHAKSTQEEGPGDREARIQKFGWTADGRPDFLGGPVDRDSEIMAPSDAPQYALFCSEYEYQGRFCVGLPAGAEYDLNDLEQRFGGIENLNKIQSVKLVGGATAEFYARFGSGGKLTQVWGIGEDAVALQEGAFADIAAIKIVSAVNSKSSSRENVLMVA